MAGNPRTVTADVVFTWDGVSQRLPRGQAIDVTPGSALEAAIGRDRLVPLGLTSALPPVEPPARKPQQEEPPAAPPKAAAAKKQDAGTDGKDGAP
jgi:hypothetical protein